MVDDHGLLDLFLDRAGLGPAPTLAEVVEAIRQIPYARPKNKSWQGVVAEWRGTCSTKHALLVRFAEDRWHESDINLVHRVYRLTPRSARIAFGADVAQLVPKGGLTDVHTYAVLVIDGQRTQVDVTFPGTPWDGRSDMGLACGAGRDFDAGADPWAKKDALIREYCDPRVREPFLAALAATRLMANTESVDP